MKQLATLAILLLCFSCGNESTTKKESINPKKTELMQHLFVGTYTKKEGHVNGTAKGIYRLDLNEQGASTSDSIYAATSINPSFIAISPNKKFLFAVNELNPNDGESGTVSAYRIDEKTKDLHFLNQQITHSFAPCHITVDATNRLAFVANYVGGVVCVYPIKENGELEVASQVLKLEGKGVTDRQESSHPHSTTISPNNDFIYIADLGTDKIMSYRIDFDGKKLLPTEQAFVKLADGAGPRHFDFHSNGKLAYVVNELNSTVTVFDFDASNGQLTEQQTISTLPEGFKDFSLCADIQVHPNGQFLFATNRGHNSIAIFKIGESGKLEWVGAESTQGDFPRNFTISPDGNHLWVANQNSDTILKFKIDLKTGNLSHEKTLKVNTPVCLEFL